VTSQLGAGHGYDDVNKLLQGDANVRVPSKEKHKDYSRAEFAKCANLPCVRKINKGRFDDITVEDVKQLFHILDANGTDRLEFEEINSFLQEVLDPPCSSEEVELLWQFADVDDSKFVCPEELYSGLVAGPIKTHLKAKQKEHKIKMRSARARGLTAQVDRDLLCERIAWRVARDDSFATLPLSTLSIAVFISLVVSHLNIYERRSVANGIEAWVTGYGAHLAGPFLESYVADVNGMWDWLSQSGVPSVLGNCMNDTETNLPTCRLGSRNIVVGDAQLKQWRSDGSMESTWLLHSVPAQAHLTSNPGDYLGAAKSYVDNLWAQRWADEETDELQLTFVTWCPRQRMFAITEVRAIFNEYGQVSPVASATAAMIDPYADFKLYIVDVLYIVLLMYPTYCELKDMISSCKLNGCYNGFVYYWSLWNGVDWVNIGMGVFSSVLWIMSCFAMQAPSVGDLLAKEGPEGIDPAVMSLSDTDLEQIEADIRTINSLFFYLTISMGTNAISIVAKFFKAFQANPRLRLVTDTMVRASTDIAHFGIVFLAVFLAFAVIGHIYFGSDLVQFSSFTRSINTAFVVLMGDFGWYVDVSDALVGLGSGVPRFTLVLWFWSYMLFVLLILLNMLLAIVLEHYTVLQEEVRNSTDARAVWTQARNFVRRVKDTKGFIPLEHLQFLLEEAAVRAHPEVKVTKDSLLRAFDGMKGTQADWLMSWLGKEAALKMMEGEDDEVTALLKEIEGIVESVAEEQKVIGLNVQSCSQQLSRLKDIAPEFFDVSIFRKDSQSPTPMGASVSMQAGFFRQPETPKVSVGFAPSMSSSVGQNYGGYNGVLGPGQREGTAEAYEMAQAPPLRGKLAEQLSAQAQAIKDMSLTVAELSTRMETVAPRMQPLPVALRELTQDVSSIKTRVDKLASHLGTETSSAQRSTAPMSARPRPPPVPPREVPSCWVNMDNG